MRTPADGETEGDRWIAFGRIGRAHGVRGEVKVLPGNPKTQLLQPGQSFERGASGAEPGARKPVEVQSARHTPKAWLVKFRGVDSRTDAEALTNETLYVRRDLLPAVDDDEVYLSDLVGMTARRQGGGDVGVIRGFFDNKAHDVCVIERTDGKEVLIPFRVENIVDIDMDERWVLVEIPVGIPGLEEEDAK